jgi:hypothetical protein
VPDSHRLHFSAVGGVPPPPTVTQRDIQLSRIFCPIEKGEATRHRGTLKWSLERMGGHMTEPANPVPKKYRNRLHRLKNAYRKAYRREPDLEPPVTDEAAVAAITLLEDAVRRAGEPLPAGFVPKGAAPKKKRRK